MRNGCSCFSDRLRVSVIVLFALAVVLLAAEHTEAQPGDRLPSLEQLEKELAPRLAELDRQIGGERRNETLYMERAKLYVALKDRANYYGRPSTLYAKNALADLSTAIELKPTAAAYITRSSLHNILEPPPQYEDLQRPKGAVDYYLKANDEAISDLRHAVALTKDKDELAQHFGALGDFYLFRGQNLAKPAEMLELRARGEHHSVWDDFDKAIEYALRALEHASPKWGAGYFREGVVRSYESKARAAYELGELDIALTAFQAGEEYFPDDFVGICSYYLAWGDTYVRKGSVVAAIEKLNKALRTPDWNCRDVFARRGELYEGIGETQKALADYTSGIEKEAYAWSTGVLSIKRARLYMEMGEADKARADLDHALSRFNADIEQCPQVYLLRARVYRQLGKLDRALTDELTAGKLSAVTPRTPPRRCVEY